MLTSTFVFNLANRLSPQISAPELLLFSWKVKNYLNLNLSCFIQLIVSGQWHTSQPLVFAVKFYDRPLQSFANLARLLPSQVFMLILACCCQFLRLDHYWTNQATFRDTFALFRLSQFFQWQILRFPWLIRFKSVLTRPNFPAYLSD